MFVVLSAFSPFFGELLCVVGSLFGAMGVPLILGVRCGGRFKGKEGLC